MLMLLLWEMEAGVCYTQTSTEIIDFNLKGKGWFLQLDICNLCENTQSVIQEKKAIIFTKKLIRCLKAFKLKDSTTIIWWVG